MLLENYSLSLSTLPSRNNRIYSTNCARKRCVCFNEIIWFMEVKMKNRSHRYDINRARPRHGHKYTKNKKCLSVMILTYNKQLLSNTWSSIHEKVKQHRLSWKKALLIKKVCIPPEPENLRLILNTFSS